MSEAAWWVGTRLLPALLVCASLPLLALAVALWFAGGPDGTTWTLAGLGAAAWASGIGWGVLVNRVGPALRPV